MFTNWISKVRRRTTSTLTLTHTQALTKSIGSSAHNNINNNNNITTTITTNITSENTDAYERRTGFRWGRVCEDDGMRFNIEKSTTTSNSSCRINELISLSQKFRLRGIISACVFCLCLCVSVYDVEYVVQRWFLRSQQTKKMARKNLFK